MKPYIKRDNCNIQIFDHNIINSNVNMFKMIKASFKIDNHKHEIYYTNNGWMKHNLKTWFCPKKFYLFQAQKFILSLPEILDFNDY